MKYLSLGVLLLSLSGVARAIPGAIKWDEPLTCENGQPIANCPVARYELEWVNLSTMKRGVKFPKVGTKGYMLQLPTLGDYGFRIRSHGTSGSVSVWSAQIQGRLTGDPAGKMIKLPIVPGPTPDPVPPNPCNCVCPPL